MTAGVSSQGDERRRGEGKGLLANGGAGARGGIGATPEWEGAGSARRLGRGWRAVWPLVNEVGRNDGEFLGGLAVGLLGPLIMARLPNGEALALRILR
ncbi:vegetative cell wall protein gp1-like [Iris pallida]|uniref:Vegetative cell wall protein gp1-like n=1 Tax=Iris pallida TaxID=29817 RepID=A0AAX6G5X0_IRIPA|nr:vegetative cell wall protein gp1-like [Iris pallida]